jgi:hypothetical protein
MGCQRDKLKMQTKWRFLVPAILFLGSLLFGGGTLAFGQSFGDFQLSYGYNYGLGARKDILSSNKESAPAKFAFFFSPRFSVRVEVSSIKSQRTEGQARNTGAGDTTFGTNFVLVTEDPQKKRPALAIDYSAKAPTACKGLGSGEVDHQLLGILSRSCTKRLYGEIDAGAYIAGVAQGASTKSGLVSVIGTSGVGHDNGGDFRWAVLEEVDLGTAVQGSPTSLTSTTLLSRILSSKWTLVGGINVGITPFDPKFGLTLGIKYSGSFRKKSL